MMKAGHYIHDLEKINFIKMHQTDIEVALSWTPETMKEATDWCIQNNGSMTEAKLISEELGLSEELYKVFMRKRAEDMSSVVMDTEDFEYPEASQEFLGVVDLVEKGGSGTAASPSSSL
eukprot:6607068-Lingulodinium_polyedra.AAC.1